MCVVYEMYNSAVPRRVSHSPCSRVRMFLIPHTWIENVILSGFISPLNKLWQDIGGNKAYAAAGVAIAKLDAGYRSEMPQTKSKKMMYSSVTDEDRRRADQVKEERAN